MREDFVPFRRYPDGTPLRVRVSLPRVNWRADPVRGPDYEIPQETPMIDLNQPLYDQNGHEWHALKGGDGCAYVGPDDVAYLVPVGTRQVPSSFDAKRGGFLASAFRDYVLTNEKPRPDWLRTLTSCNTAETDCVVVKVGRRNGELFAEVVK